MYLRSLPGINASKHDNKPTKQISYRNMIRPNISCLLKETPCVTLHTKERANHPSGDRFEGGTDAKLETLLDGWAGWPKKC